MKYAVISVLVVAAALGGLFIMVDSEPENEQQAAADIKEEQRFQPLPEISRPDYGTVVTDDALRAELTAEAKEYIDSITAGEGSGNGTAQGDGSVAGSQGATGGGNASGGAGSSGSGGASASGTSGAVASAGGANGADNSASNNGDDFNGYSGSSDGTSSDLSEFGVSLGTVAEQGGVRLYTMNSEIEINGETVSIKKLLERHGRQPVRGGIYYVHRVSDDDTQGVWGVIQGGLIKRFGDGVAEKRAADQDKYSVLIPENADERLPNGLSSFLGKVIHYKVFDSEVFTNSAGLMKNNKDIIYPGDDVVIVMFKPSELISVYQYFATRGTTGDID